MSTALSPKIKNYFSAKFIYIVSLVPDFDLSKLRTNVYVQVLNSLKSELGTDTTG